MSVRRPRLLLLVLFVLAFFFSVHYILAPTASSSDAPSKPSSPFYKKKPLGGVDNLEDEDRKGVGEVVDAHEEDGEDGEMVKEVIKEVVKEVVKMPKGLEMDLGVGLKDLETEIDLLQVQFLDYLHGELGKGEKDKPFGGSLLKFRKDEFDYKSVWKTILAYTLQIVNEPPYDRKDFLQLGRRARSLLIMDKLVRQRTDLHQELIFHAPLASSSSSVERGGKMEMHSYILTQLLSKTIKELTNTIYPYLQPKYPRGIPDIQSTFKGKGIVISTGKFHFKLALHAIRSIREVLNSTLPIEVVYGGPGDLDPGMIKAFERQPNVKCLDIYNHFGEESHLFGGWSIKPFAILGSSFEEVIFMDADTLFFQDPRVLLEKSERYNQTGALFFLDRTIGGTYNDWFTKIQPNPSQVAKNGRYMRKLTVHEMESGVVVVDKGNIDVLHALLVVCKMNSQFERDKVTYKNMHGDKESFWISFEVLRVPYTYPPSYGGTVGYKNVLKPQTDAKGTEICGGLFHTDEKLQPLWWNGGVVANKHSNQEKNMLQFEYYAFDTVGEGIKWLWETDETPFCLLPSKPKEEIGELNGHYKWIGGKYVEMYEDIVKLEKEGKLIE
ncbi:hypothetical protein HDV05_005242 [Chytridiales sp. JEL 0842]|nr:hypothetical protein HDV05_005242 [Chytridiales sp. JEL 0842]